MAKAAPVQQVEEHDDFLEEMAPRVYDGAERPLQEWLQETDEAYLRAAHLQVPSYPEYVAIVHRLTEIAHHTKLPEPDFEAQPLDQAFEHELRERGGQARAVFVRGSLFRDHIAYAEYKPTRRPRQIFRCKWNERLEIDGKLSERLGELSRSGPDGNQWDVPQWDQELALLTHSKLELPSEAVTDEGLGAHIATHAPSVDKQASGEERAQIYTWMRERLEGAAVLNRKWRLTDDAQFNLLADVESGKREKQLFETLIQAGANIEDNVLHYHDYGEAGKRLTLTLAEDRFVHYVPHYSVGTREVEEFSHVVNWQGADTKRRQLIHNAIWESFEQHRVQANDIMVTREEFADQEREDRVLLVQINRIKPEYAQRLREAAESGVPITRGKGGSRERLIHAFFATPERINEHPDYYIELDDAKDGGSGGWMYHYAHRARERILAATPELAKLKVTIEWSCEDEEAPQVGVSEGATSNFDQMKKAIREWGRVNDIDRDIINLIRHEDQLECWSHSVSSRMGRKNIPHDAPYSERGVLRLENFGPQEAVHLLQELGCIEGLCPEVPYQLIYRGSHRRGRVLPWHPDYATGRESLTLPDGYMVLHGLTGIISGGAFDRLSMIVESGGLKSISERRRMSINAGRTMSPGGDIGSGIDIGVPTRISSSGCPGSGIYFGMKPEVLYRRDLFFSNTDFGGNTGRYESYNAYAEKIGQGKVHHVASHTARKTHIEHGLNGSNECYLRYEIPFDEIDTLFVTDKKLMDKVTTAVKAWKASGDLPEDLKVMSLDDQRGLQEQIKQRTDDLAGHERERHPLLRDMEQQAPTDEASIVEASSESTTPPETVTPSASA